MTCKCGKRMSKHSYDCKSCHDVRMDNIRARDYRYWKSHACPECGSKLVRNNALAGWWQCSQYGNWKLSVGDLNKPNCSFQCFTE